MDLLGDIVEHNLEGAQAAPPRPKVITVKSRKGNTVGGFPRATRQRPSRWRQRLAKKGLSSMSDAVKVDPLNPSPADKPTSKEQERETMSKQNMAFINSMTPAQKEQAKQEILENVSSETLKLLIKRSKKVAVKQEKTPAKPAKVVRRKDAIPDMVPTIEGDNTWIGGYRTKEDAERAEAAKPVKDDDTNKNTTASTNLKSALKKENKSKNIKKVKFNNEAKVQYPDEVGKKDSDDEWENIEYLDDAGPTYEDAKKISDKKTKEAIKDAKFKTRKEPYEKLDLNDPDFNEKLHEKYFPDLPMNANQLEWMSNKNVPQTPVDISYDSLDDLRFDFKGDIITGENIAKYSKTTSDGLHNHSAHPELPGYTLPELGQYLRSTYPGQRCIASRTLGRIMYKLGKLQYSVTEVTNKKVGGPERQHRDAAGHEGLFERKCWEIILQLQMIPLLEQSAADTEKNVSVRNYAIDALWLWSQGGGDEICKRVAKEIERERDIYKV